ncbi:hypothetical protein DERP_008513 [Dermatophagoides pteronyssinus]|uniref:Geranylgeranyl transferase type-2 subunit alpha n=1 Tax=Dermatophagoides pteronyssinus TaxID=6956 RepID=A0ABQ8IVG5_DERPT|nr:hypothetical protein DERP_008513 [Dermatophagoides pteronyssinus]
MHSRKKVTVKDETKEKAKLLKAQKFHSELTNHLIKKSTCKDLDSLESLARLLQINPEFGTLFNYRREILLNFKQSLETNEQSSDGDDPENQPKEELWKKFDQLCEKELMFTENCLQSSPKSYATWHHRIWLIKQMRNPNFNRELELCNKCLSLDERNFHCWDYRRFIVRFGKIPTMDEFRFTSKKILDNFSNFSSWHYRSSLFRQLLAENYDLEELQSMIDKDFETVKNAIFTDPNDQSPWLYFRWLIDFEQELLSFGDEKEISPKCYTQIERFVWSQNHHLLAIEFNRSLDRFPFEILINQQKIDLNSFHSKFNGKIWIVRYVDQPKTSSSDSIRFEFSKNQTTILKHEFNVENINDCCVYNRIFVDNDYGQRQNIRTNLIRKRIDDLNVLLEIESDSKWPNYMLTIALDTDNFETNLNASNNNNRLDRLISIDPLRCNYYKDLKKMTILKQKLFSKDFDQIIKQIL